MRKLIVMSSLAALFGVILAGSFVGCDGPDYPEAGGDGGEGFIYAIGPELVDSEGNTTSSDMLSDKDYVLLYFSAEWCPPCREFTAKLVDFYDEYAEAGNLELVLISADRSEADMYDYMQNYDMDWLALPYDRRDESGLAEKYGVRGIPKLVAIDGDGNVIKDSDRDGHVEMLEELVGKF